MYREEMIVSVDRWVRMAKQEMSVSEKLQAEAARWRHRDRERYEMLMDEATDHEKRAANIYAGILLEWPEMGNA